MKSPVLRTLSYRGRSKQRSESTSGDGKVPKIAAKDLSFDSSPELTPDRTDLPVSSPDSSIIYDPTPEKGGISPLSLSPMKKDTETGGSGEIAGGSPGLILKEREDETIHVPAVATAMVAVPAVSASSEESTTVIDQVRQALDEMRSSTDMSDASKRLLDVLVETAIGGDSSRGRGGRVSSRLSLKILVIAVSLLVGWVVAANFLLLSMVYAQVSFTDFPPT